MKASLRLFRARVALACGVMLAAAGALLVGWFALAFTGDSLPQWGAFMLAAVLLTALGLLIVRRQRALIGEEGRRREDRLRRLRDYRRDSSRIEPVDSRREPYLGVEKSAKRVA